MVNNEAQEVLRGMSTGMAKEMELLTASANGILNLLEKLISREKAGTTLNVTINELLVKAEDINVVLNNVSCVTIPYANRIAFEKEMANAGLRFSRCSDLDMGNIEQQMYIIDPKDKFAVFELTKKYSYLQPRHIITNEEQEKEYFQGCPITDVSGFDKTSADRALRLLDEKGVLVGISLDPSSGEYTLRVPRDKEKILLEVIKEVEVFREDPNYKWIEMSSAYRGRVNDYIKNAGDFNPDNPCVIYDAEKPNHMLLVSKEGYEERYVTMNEHNEAEEQFVYRNSLNNAITKGRYQELLNSDYVEDRQKATDFTPSYEKMTENREEFDRKLAAIVDRMGTPTFIDKKTFDRLTDEQKMAPSLITQQALEAELTLTQEGDRLKAYTITKNERGSIIIELNASIEHGETDINKDRLNRAVKSTEVEKILDEEEITSRRKPQEKAAQQMKEERNSRIETNLSVRSTGFAAGEQRKDGQTIIIEHDDRSRINNDDRDVDRSGSIQDELLEAEQKSNPVIFRDTREEGAFEERYLGDDKD